MLDLVTILVGAVLAGVVVANVSASTLAALAAGMWLLGTPITRWAWEVFVGQDKSRAWKWAWAVALGGLWPLWALLAVLYLAGRSRAK